MVTGVKCGEPYTVFDFDTTVTQFTLFREIGPPLIVSLMTVSIREKKIASTLKTPRRW
jgi:hypothetical protein